MTDAFQKEVQAAFNAPRDHLVALVERVMGAEVVVLGRVTKGYVNEVYRAELASSETVVIRIRRRGGVSFTSEAWALGACRRVGVPVPAVYAVTTLHGDEPLEVMVLAQAPGQPLGDVWAELAEVSRKQVMGYLGTALRVQHSVEAGGWGRRGEHGAWEHADWESRASAAVAERTADIPILRGVGLTEAEAAALIEIVRVMASLSAPLPVLCHGDLGMDHVFIDGALTITGMIDFGMWQGGPRELDFAVLTMYHPEVQLAWLEQNYQGGPFDSEFYRRVLVEQINVGIGFLAHDVRQGNADYLDLALQGMRASLRMWHTLG
jgi:aminoglycoside phosphotransferase (APT) family kinase protein